MARIQEAESPRQWGSRRLVKAFAGACLILVSIAVPAGAQMQLPGAIGGGAPAADGERPSGAGGEGAGSPSSYAPPKPVAMKPPAEETVTGHVLSRDGASGEMVLTKSGDGLVLSKLEFEGEQISKPGKTCKVSVSLDAPLAVTPAGRPVGTIRYGVPVSACPFTIDILDGAVLVSRPQPTCDFAAADCRVTPGGLWGPHAADITPKQAKDLEHELVRLETTMRTNFRALVRKAGSDRNAVKAIAREQAAFSSEREMTCRDYQQETVHGFCSTRITQARALALMAQFGPGAEAPRNRTVRASAPPRPPKESPLPPEDADPR